MRYRTLVIVAVIVGVQAAPGHAQSPEDKASALLRASSTQSAIITFCAKHYAIDGTTALRISQTAREVAAKVLGQDRSDAAFKEELARRYAEVKESGELEWCTAQRAALSQDDAKIFKD